MRVLTAHRFFAHYREGVFRALMASRTHEHLFCGDLEDGATGIRSASMETWPNFRRCRSYRMGRVVLQPGLLLNVIRSGAKTVIFSGDVSFLTTWMAAAVARVLGKRVLFWTHGWTRPDVGVKSWVRCSFYRLAHGLLLYGQRAKGIGVANGFNPDALYVIYNSLDYEAQRAVRDAQSPEGLLALRRTLFESPELPIVLCVTRLTGGRRLDQLIAAVALLKGDGHRLNVLLVGDGPARAELESQAAELAVPLRCVGECYDAELLGRYNLIAAVTVAPGMVGLTAMQSMAFGVPVITHGDMDAQMPEAEAIEPGVTGDFFVRDDVENLARAIRNWTGQATPSDAVRRACIDRIEQRYTPEFQSRIIDLAVSNEPAGKLPFQDAALCR